MAPSVEKLAETGVFFTVTSLPMVMNVHADAENPLWRAALGRGRRRACVGAMSRSPEGGRVNAPVS